MIEMLDKRQGEGDLEYHRRLIYGKILDKTLADEDYSEISKRIYDREYCSDTARRMMYGSAQTLKLIDSIREKAITDGDVIGDLRSQKVEIQKETQKYFDQRREYKKLLSDAARQEHLEERLVEAASSLSKEIPLAPCKCFSSHGDKEAVLVLCDWHFGMTTDNIWNTYNTDICKRRLEEITAMAIEHIETNRPRVLHVVILGDLSHGAIHTSARVASEELVCDQIMKTAEMAAQMISILSDYVETTNVYSTFGNHLRTVQNKRDNLHDDNMERLIPWWLEQRFKDRDDIFVRSECSINEYLYFTVCGCNIAATHGDLDGIRTSPQIVNTLFSKKFGTSIDYVLLADKHHIEEFEAFGIESILGKALCGSDDYANEHRLFSSAGQTLIMFDPRYGRDATYHMKVK